MRKIFIKILITFLCFFGVIKLFHLDHNEKVLNFFAKYFFDKEYYLATYPEITEKDDPFTHYINLGWKEGKNPNKSLDTKFYVNLYLMNNKYKLNPLTDYVRAKASFKTRYLTPSQLNPITPLDNPKYYLTLVAIF